MNSGDSAFVTNFVLVVGLLAVDFWTVRVARAPAPAPLARGVAPEC